MFLRGSRRWMRGGFERGTNALDARLYRAANIRNRGVVARRGTHGEGISLRGETGRRGGSDCFFNPLRLEGGPRYLFRFGYFFRGTRSAGKWRNQSRSGGVGR